MYYRSFFPDAMEALLFISICGLLILILTLYHNSNIQTIVLNSSRCYRIKEENSSGSDKIYKAYAFDANNNPLINIIYDLTLKKMWTEQACPAGNIPVTLTTPINQYNFLTKKITKMTPPTINCAQSNASAYSDTAKFKGPQKLIDFLVHSNTEIFNEVNANGCEIVTESILTGSNH